MGFHWEVDVDKLNFKLYNVKDGGFFVPAPPKNIWFQTKYNNFFKLLNDYVDIIVPIGDGEFSLVYSDGAFFDKISDGDIDIENDVLYRFFGDSFPSMKQYLYPVFEDILNNKEIKNLNLCFYEENKLLKYIKMKLFYYDGFIVALSEDMTENYQLKTNEKKSFHHDTKPKCIVQDGFIVKANKYHMELFNKTEEEILQTPIKEINNSIIYNDTGLILTYEQMVDKILNNEYSSIIYDVKFHFPEGIKTYQAVAAKTEFNGRGAVYNSIINELNDTELMNNDNFDSFQEYTNSAFVIYDFISHSYSESRNFENLIEGKVPLECDLMDFFNSLIIPEDKPILEHIYETIFENQQLLSEEYRIKSLKGNLKYFNVINKPIVENGKLTKCLVVLRDITKYKLQNEKLNRLYNTLQDVQKATSTSIQYDTPDGEFVWTPEIYEIIEREPRESDNYTNVVFELADDDERERFEKLLANLKPNEFLGSNRLRITTENGKVKYLQIDARKIYDDNNNFIQRNSYAQDVTEQVYLEKERELLSTISNVVLKSLKIGTFTINRHSISHFSESLYEIMGVDRSIEEVNLEEELKKNIVIRGDLEKNPIFSNGGIKDIYMLFNNNDDEFSYTFEYKHPSWKESKFLTIYSVPHYFDNHKIFIGAIQDVTLQVKYENELIETSEENEILVKEVHHRVKNNLQVITSFISLEERFHKSSPRRIVEITKNRINSLALIHERIYNEESMRSISLKEFIKDFDDKLFALANYDDVIFVDEMDDDLTLPVDIMTPIVLIINELTTNTFKYAFSDDDYKEIFKSVNVYEENNQKICEFIYKDNGRGLPEGFDINTSKSLGWTIIKSLSIQLEGKYELFNDNGFGFKLSFPFEDN